MVKLRDQKIIISLIDSCNKFGVYTHSASPEKQPQRYPPYGLAVVIKEVPILRAKARVDVRAFTTLYPHPQQKRFAEHFSMLDYIPSFSPGGSNSRWLLFRIEADQFLSR